MLPLILAAVGGYLVYDSLKKPVKEYSDGGMAKQGYDDREDERLGMRHGKMSDKDLHSTQARRDDARFEERMAAGGMMADGGMAKQGYDDREDERLGMRHGKMSDKDLHSTQARRDDARFEERMAAGGMAKGGMKKEDLIEQIVDDLKNNMFESEDYIFDLVREALRTRTFKELKFLPIKD